MLCQVKSLSRLKHRSIKRSNLHPILVIPSEVEERGGLARCVTRLAGYLSEAFREGAESPSRTGGSGLGARAPQFRRSSLIRRW